MESKATTALSRRGFVKASAAATAAIALSGTLAGCETAVKKTEETDEAFASSLTEGEWKSAACWHNCGGRCVNKVLVQDGVVVRQKTDDTHPDDDPDFPQQRACARGHSQRHQVFGADRLRYPMKRKSWQPGGKEINGHLRGIDEWERISWDEAIDIAVSEIKRIREAYGPEAVFSPSGKEIQRALALSGGFTPRWGQYSWGGWTETYAFVAGDDSGEPNSPNIFEQRPSSAKNYSGHERTGANDGNDRIRLRKSELIVLWGCNPAVSGGGNPPYNYLQAKKAGAKFICVDPIYSDSARIFDAQWIPCRPSTDITLIFGMMYTMLDEGLHKQEYLDKYCIGFDAEHMPEGADPQDNFKDYLLGTYDGTPKTPEWASEICGVEPDVIREFARQYATAKSCAIVSGGAPARTNCGEDYAHAILTLAMMSGNMGNPAGGVAPTMHKYSGNGGPRLVECGTDGIGRKMDNACKTRLNNGNMWRAILDGEYLDNGETKPITVKAIIHGGDGATLSQNLGSGGMGIEAHRAVEFVMAQYYDLTTDAKYSDLVLPVTTKWEQDGGVDYGNREIAIVYSRICEPLYEAKDDFWIARQIGKGLGANEEEVEPKSMAQRFFDSVAGTKVCTDDGTKYEPLVTITQEKIDELGVQGEPQTGRVEYDQFLADGVYQFPRKENDKFEFTAFEDHIADPDAHPLNTKSGKFEIYCESLAEKIEGIGFSTKHAHPYYEPPVEGYEAGIADGYPFQLANFHYQRRAHSNLDNVPWLRRAFAQEFWMNASDAAELGIADGDIAKVTSRHGTVLRPVYATERMRPGACLLGEGAWMEFDEDGNDRAGATNTLTGQNPTGEGHSGFNSCNVRIEKYNGTLEADYTWPQRIFFAEEGK